MLKQTPLASIGVPPSEVILPPVYADVEVIDDAPVVVRIGIVAIGGVVKVN